MSTTIHHKGLQVIFKKPLFIVKDGFVNGFSTGGAVFPISIVEIVDFTKNSLYLREDYSARVYPQSSRIDFVSPLPDAFRIMVSCDLIAQILDIASEKIIFPVES